MEYSRRRVAVLVVVGVALATNSLWLVPNEGTSRYTYDRAAATVENGTISYEGRGAFEGFNDLAAVECEQFDPGGRDCAFEAYLAVEGSVNVSKAGFAHLEEDPNSFVALSDGYYRRTRESVDEETLSYGLEPVDAEQVLRAVSQKSRSGNGEAFLGERVATGGSVTTTAPPEAVSGVGEVYEVDGTYYVIVVTAQESIDRVPVPLPRTLLGVIGGLVLVGAAYLVGREQVRRHRIGERIRERV